ncbi:MAG: hypothetical protein HYY18_01970 [Planctomycetes bacterium]|nr:hypothetical protein [Planctomycetota bacterium]
MFIIGLVIMLVGGIWLLIEAFKESVLWGLGCLFIPIVSLIFVILHWDKAGKPFLIQVVGAVLFAIGGGFAHNRVASVERPETVASVRGD